MSSADLTLILPECVMLLWINGLLLFGLMFSSVNFTFDQSKEKAYVLNHKLNFNNTAISEKQNSVIKYKPLGLENLFKRTNNACLISPALITEPCARFMVLGLALCAHLYLNLTLTHGFALTTLIWDPLGRIMSVLLCLSAAASVILSTQTFKRFSRYEFILILWLSILGMLCLIKSYDFLAFYLSVELQSLSFYMLAAMRSRTEASAEAGLKYFILSAFSSALLLLGMALIYGSIGSINFADTCLTLSHFEKNSAYSSVILTLGLGCIIVSLLFKLGAVPFHTWVADVYEGSNTGITSWFALTPKFALLCVLIRLISYDCDPYLVNILTSVALLSLIVGSLSAMRQIKLKRLIAFSSIANVGWFLLALVSGQWQTMLLHLIVYTLLSVILFATFLIPLFRTHPDLNYRVRYTKGQVSDHGADSTNIKYISDLHQLSKVNPCLAFAVCLALFSLAGMPPLAGFYSKYLILNALTQAELYGVLALALGTALLSAFYYLRVIKTLYFAGNVKTSYWFSVYEIPVNALVLSYCCAINVLFFVKPDYICVWLATI